MFRKKKIKTEQIRKKLDELEEQGKIELTVWEIHDYLYHDFNPPTWKSKIFVYGPIFLFLLFMMLAFYYA